MSEHAFRSRRVTTTSDPQRAMREQLKMPRTLPWSVRINPRVASFVTALFACLLAGCSDGQSSDSNVPPPTASSASASIPSDGITLAALGYIQGPVQQFSLPRTAVITTKVDQPNNVTAVVSSPPASEVGAYLRRALPAAGFMITADRPAENTMTFAGHGWSGSFTGDDRASAVLLRPQ
jgi:hypothetical protein